MSAYIKPAILVGSNEGIQMRLAAQLSYQQSAMQLRIPDDLPKAEEPNQESVTISQQSNNRFKLTVKPKTMR